MRKLNLVKTAVPVGAAGDRVVLFSWALSDEPRLENIARLDRSGAVLWRAALPAGAAHDCFVHLAQQDGMFVARTYSGCEVRFDAQGRSAGPVLAAA